MCVGYEYVPHKTPLQKIWTIPLSKVWIKALKQTKTKITRFAVDARCKVSWWFSSITTPLKKQTDVQVISRRGPNNSVWTWEQSCFRCRLVYCSSLRWRSGAPLQHKNKWASVFISLCVSATCFNSVQLSWIRFSRLSCCCSTFCLRFFLFLYFFAIYFSPP